MMPYASIRSLANRLSMGGRLGIANTLCRRIFSRARANVEIDDFDGNLRMRLDLSEHMQRRIFWMGYYNNEIVPLIKKLLRSGMVFVDVGANIGELALIAARQVGAEGRVIAFEPVASIASRLREHVTMNGMPWIDVVELALSDHSGDARIYTTTTLSGSKENNLGLSSLHHVHPDEAPSESIRVGTLDAYRLEHGLERIDGMKIDIEGAELECLKGAIDTLETLKPWLVIEVQQQAAEAAGYRQEQILQLLEPLGYAFFRISRHGHLHRVTADTLEAFQNVLCLPLDRHYPELDTP